MIPAAEATPIFGVTRVGDVSTTNLVPVPVCDAIEVALPTEVIGPVKLALVVTLPAVKLAAVPVRPVPAPVKLVDESAPVDGLKFNLVLVTFNGRLPVFVVTHTRFIEALVVVSFVIGEEEDEEQLPKVGGAVLSKHRVPVPVFGMEVKPTTPGPRPRGIVPTGTCHCAAAGAEIINASAKISFFTPTTPYLTRLP